MCQLLNRCFLVVFDNCGCLTIVFHSTRHEVCTPVDYGSSCVKTVELQSLAIDIHYSQRKFYKVMSKIIPHINVFIARIYIDLNHPKLCSWLIPLHWCWRTAILRLEGPYRRGNNPLPEKYLHKLHRLGILNPYLTVGEPTTLRFSCIASYFFMELSRFHLVWLSHFSFLDLFILVRFVSERCLF